MERTGIEPVTSGLHSGCKPCAGLRLLTDLTYRSRCRAPVLRPVSATRFHHVSIAARHSRPLPLGVAGAVDLAGVHVERRRHVRVGIALETAYTSSPAAISMPAKLWRQSCRTGFRRPAASRFAFTAAVNAASIARRSALRCASCPPVV